MWYKVFADGTLQDIVLANSPIEAVVIVKAKIRFTNPDISFNGIHWTYRYYG